MWRALRKWGDGRRWPSFALWALMSAFVVLVPFSLGSVLLLTPALVVLLAVLWPLLRPVSPAGLLAGAGAALLLFGASNIPGPGTVCTSGPDWSSCTEYSDPRPWLLAGTALVLVAIGLEFWARHRTHSAAGGLT